MIDPNAKYDSAKEVPTPEQSALARAHFEFAQAVRRALANDNKLTPGEVFSIVASQSPQVAASYVGALGDENSDVDDFITAAHLVAQQYI
jgi:hypothetical protein